jgi:uncharacterized protein (TIGR04141 family)
VAAVPVRDLTVYLLKDVDRAPEEFVPDRSRLKTFEIGEGQGKVGTLFVRMPKSRPPTWASLFKEFLDAADIGRTSSSSAIFLIRTQGRVFAITFGQGRFLLEDDCWEERFGLKVALNTVGESSLRSVDKVTFDAIAAHTRTQSSRSASAMEFGVDWA